jgi:hypothetical protein
VRRGPWFLVAGLLGPGLACAHQHGAAADPGAALPPAVHVTVTNHYSTDVEIFVTASGATLRLGSVAPGIDRTFMLPRGMVGNGSVELSAQPAGYGPLVRSGALVLSPGDFVYFEITHNWIDSRATVRP